MHCDRCEEKAIYNRRYSGQKFCKEHFIAYFERKVKRTIKNYDMIKRGERIGVALSGGKDSITTLSILGSLRDLLEIELFAITIDEGISEYREKSLKTAIEFCEKNEIPLITVSFVESFGKPLDEMSCKNACSICGVFRRRLLNDKAKELNLAKLATGHNLDDETQAIMMNYIRGDIDRLYRLTNAKKSEKFVRRIKPLCEMPEKEVGLYAILKFNIDFSECPFAAGSFRTGIRNFINQLEKDNPGIKFSIFKGYKKLLPYLDMYPKKELRECRLCGGPTSGDVCKVCDMLKQQKIYIGQQ